MRIAFLQPAEPVQTAYRGFRTETSPQVSTGGLQLCQATLASYAGRSGFMLVGALEAGCWWNESYLL